MGGGRGSCWTCLFLFARTAFFMSACRAHISSYKPLWGLMNTITAGTGTVYSEGKDEFVMKGVCGKKDADGRATGLKLSGMFSCLSTTYSGEKSSNNFTVARRARLACFSLTCGGPAALCRFVYVFAFRDSRTKTFTKTANDDGVELFCQEPDAMAVRSIVICNNMLITARAMTAINFCFRTTKLDISGCSELSCGLCVYE